MKNKALTVLEEEFGELQRKIKIGDYFDEKSMIIRRDKLQSAIIELKDILQTIKDNKGRNKHDIKR